MLQNIKLGKCLVWLGAGISTLLFVTILLILFVYAMPFLSEYSHHIFKAEWYPAAQPNQALS